MSLQKSGYTTGFMGKYLNGYQPTNAVPPGWNTWDVAGNGYPEFNYTLNENGKQQKYGKDPSDYLVDVLSQKAGSFIDTSAASGKPSCWRSPHLPRTRRTRAPRYASAAKDGQLPEDAGLQHAADQPAVLAQEPTGHQTEAAEEALDLVP